MELRAKKPKYEGVAGVEDIVAALERLKPAFLRNEPTMKEEDFAKLPRDSEGNLISLSHKAVHRRLSKEQLMSLTQNAKDYIRYLESIQMI